ncbi:MAG: cytochrome P450 [Herbinix sp.]|nr:cytochrome P450 [Herbinix sp.]
MKPAIFLKMPKADIPTEKCLDSTLNLLTEGYLFIPNRTRKYNSSLFQTRLMGQKTVCMSGKEAAKLFYDQNLFTREGVIPKRIQETLFGKKGIQTLVGAAHMNRKLLFLSIMSPQQIEQLIKLTQRQWQINSKQWEKRNQVLLFEEVSKLLFQAACKWSGVPLKNSEAKKKSSDMSYMIDAFGAVGPRHWRGRCARNRTECWAKALIQGVRAGRIILPKDTALYTIAWHKDLSNKLLEPEIAAIELINILRPITAIATYITFGALALHTYPEYRDKLRHSDEVYQTMFTQEIRRYYPFGPFLGAKVRGDFKWQNHSFQKDDLVLLDLYGTNHDKMIWKDPNTFQPEHFEHREDNPFDFIPQGGGDYKTGTRCPGEPLSVELMKISIKFLVNNLEYQVPLQDLSYSLRRLPTLPKSKFIISNVKNLGNKGTLQ